MLQSSVIIVGFNSRIDLEKCLPSLLANIQEDTDYILVDNASTDGTSDWVYQNFPQINLVSSLENLGFAGACNLGAQYSQGKYLAFLNPDTIVTPGWLDALIVALESDSNAGLATSKILLLNDPQYINTCGNDVHLSGITLCRGAGKHWQALSIQEEVGAISGACFAIRRELFQVLGGFDESFFMYMEDTDLSLRVRLAGFKCVFVPDSVVYHDYTLHFGPQKTFYQERNRYLILLKNLRWRTLFFLLPTLCFAEVITWGFVFLQNRKKFLNKIWAYVWIFLHWFEVMQKRRIVQAHRCITDRQILLSLRIYLEFEQVNQSWVTKVAHLIFDPLFKINHSLLLAVVKW